MKIIELARNIRKMYILLGISIIATTLLKIYISV